MDLQVKSDYPNIRILLDIVEMLEDLRVMGCWYNLISRASMKITANKDSETYLFVAIIANHSTGLSREICYSTNNRLELERLSYEIQVLLCSERKAHIKNNQHQ